MQIIQNVLSDEEFQAELIKRFFHPKSFFFRCINHQLENLLNNSSATSEAYLIMGAFLDKLTSSENKIEFLQRLSKVSGFAEYLNQLNAGVRQLRDAELDAERMKIKIEELAQNLFQTALQALNDPNSSVQLKRRLGLETIDPPLDFNLDEVASEKSLEPPLNSLVEADPERTLQEPPGLTDEERDFLLNFEAGTDACTHGGCEAEFPDEGGSKNFNELQPASAAISREPASVVDVFRKQVQEQLEKLLRLLSASDVNLSGTWKAYDRLFEEMAAISMIYGFEAFEELAAKCRKFTPIILANLPSYALPAKELILEVREELLKLLAKDIDRVNETDLTTISEKLRDPEKALRARKAPPANDNSNGSNHSEPNPSPASDRIEEDDLPNFRLPGEDDDELMNLIREISDSEQSRKNGDCEPPPNEKCSEIDNLFSEVEELEKNASSQLAENLILFKERARPHFTVIGQALDTLRVQPASGRALQDLQEASKSLLGLSLNLNLLPLSYYPASVESLVRTIRLANAPLSENERFLIEDLYRNVFNLSRLEEIQAHDNRKLLQLIQNLNSAMQLREDYQQSEGLTAPAAGVIASA